MWHMASKQLFFRLRFTVPFLKQIQVMKDDNEAFKGSPYLTSTRGRTPPLVTSNFVVQDDGMWPAFVIFRYLHYSQTTVMQSTAELICQ